MCLPKKEKGDTAWQSAEQMVGRYVSGHGGNKKPIRKNILRNPQAVAKEKLKRAINKCAEDDAGRADENTMDGRIRAWSKLYAAAGQGSLSATSLSILFTSS